MKYLKTNRLLTLPEFRGAVKRGKRIALTYTVIDCYSGSNTPPKLGIVASKKYGKAHERNRFKRVTREAFRSKLEQLLPGMTLVVRPGKEAKNATPQLISLELLYAQSSAETSR